MSHSLEQPATDPRMTGDADIVRDFMRRVRKRHPESSWQELEAFAAELRRAWGGKRPYISTSEREPRAERMQKRR